MLRKGEGLGAGRQTILGLAGFGSRGKTGSPCATSSGVKTIARDDGHALSGLQRISGVTKRVEVPVEGSSPTEAVHGSPELGQPSTPRVHATELGPLWPAGSTGERSQDLGPGSFVHGVGDAKVATSPWKVFSQRTQVPLTGST